MPLLSLVLVHGPVLVAVLFFFAVDEGGGAGGATGPLRLEEAVEGAQARQGAPDNLVIVVREAGGQGSGSQCLEVGDYASLGALAIE